MKHLDLNSTPPVGEFLEQRKNILISHCVNLIQAIKGSNPAQCLNFFQVSVLVVLWPHLHL